MEGLSAKATPVVSELEVDVVAVLPDPHSSDGWLVSEKNIVSGDFRWAVWNQYPRPDTTDGVLTVPF